MPLRAAKDSNRAGVREVIGTTLLADSVKSECIPIDFIGIARRHTQIFLNRVGGGERDANHEYAQPNVCQGHAED